MKEEIKLIPIDAIRILNPRFRDQKRFQVIVQSIRNLGLKKPIQVSLRSPQEADGAGYDLVCGQGRIEAFLALGYKEIPAMVVEIPKEERLLRSLVENMARRFSKPADLLEEITRLKAKGYTNAEIETKLDLSHTLVSGILTLKRAGEERLVEATLSGIIPISMAMDIAKAEGADAQRALLKVYQKKQLSFEAIRTVRRLIAHRQFLGKKRGPQDAAKKSPPTSAQSIVAAYKREGERLKLMVRKAKICNTKVTFVVTAFSQLVADENYMNLLRAESLTTMPKNLWAKVAAMQKEAA
jgi:ParB family chromosome partitioning protein